MTKTDADEVEAKTKQRENSKRATFEKLSAKTLTEKEITVTLGGEEYTMLFRAISAKRWDKLISQNPPNQEQKANGQTFNPDRFGPALLADVCVEPEMTAKQWGEIWTSPDWSRGEITDIYIAAMGICNKGLDIPFSENG